jgi:hypothetical protein
MLGVLFMISSGEAPWRELGYSFAYEETELQALLVAGARDERVLILSPRIWPIYPAINYAHSHQTLPALNLWLLQGIYRECLPGGRLYRDLDEMGPVERKLYQTIAEEFAANPPKMVVIDQEPGTADCGKPFDLLEYFRRDPRFAATWSRYAFFTENNDLELYRRVDVSTGTGRAR